MLSNYRVFIHMAIFVVGLIGVSTLLGVTFLSQRWSLEETHGPAKLYSAAVKSYWTQDKRAISAEYARTQAQWQIICNNHGDKKIFLKLSAPLPNLVDQVKINWGDGPEQIYDVYADETQINFARNGEDYDVELLNRLKNSLDLRVKINITGVNENEYYWDLRGVDSKIQSASDACYTQLNFAQTGHRCVLCNLTKEGEDAHLQRLLGQANVYIDQTDQSNRTALMHARDYKTAALLLAAGANSNHRDYDNRSVLWWFDQRNDYEMIKLLLATGPEPAPPDADQNTLLHQRAQHSDGNYNAQIIMKKYLDNGFAVDAVNAVGQTPLMIAVRRGNKALYDFFRAQGAALTVKNSAGGNLIHMAYQAEPAPSNYAIIKDLVARGVPINAPDAQGELPIHKAVAQGDYARVKLLIAHGSHYKGEVDGQSLLHQAVQVPGNMKIAELLLDKGLALEGRTRPGGDTALLLAIRSNNYPMVEFLLQQNARTDLRNAAKQNAHGVARRTAYSLIAQQKAALKEITPGANHALLQEKITRDFHTRRRENRKIINLLKQART